MVDLKIMSVAAEGGTGWRVPQFKILEGTSPRNRHFYRKNPSTYNFFRIFNIFKTSDRKSRKRNQNLVEGGFSAPESPPPPQSKLRGDAPATNEMSAVPMPCLRTVNFMWCSDARKMANGVI